MFEAMPFMVSVMGVINGFLLFCNKGFCRVVQNK